MRRLFFSTALCFLPLYLSPLSHGQVAIDQLGAAQRYDSEPLNPSNGGLDPALWQGVTAQQASALLESIDLTSLSELPQIFMRRVLLSAGVPPTGDDAARENYLTVKTQAKLQLQDYIALNSLSDPQNPQQRQARFRAELALASGNQTAACNESDREIDNRGAEFWMQMRIICHIIREESAAAELTLNLMRERDDINPDFIALADTALGLRNAAPKNITNSDPAALALKTLIKVDEPDTVNGYMAIALDDTNDANERLAAMFKTKNRLAPQEVKSILSSFLLIDEDLAGGASFDIDSALVGIKSEESRAKSAGQIFTLATDYNNPQAAAQAVTALLNLSAAAGYAPQMTQVLSDALPFIRAEDQVDLDADLYSLTAIRRGDLSTLRGIYQALAPNDPLQGRIALASDALGNGFLLGELGLDIETRLQTKGTEQEDARRDALIGLALGAQMSDVTSNVFDDYDKAEKINPLRLAQLNNAAKSNARAYLLMLIVRMIGERDVKALSKLEIYSYIKALSDAGLSREAGELAAYDFMSRIPDDAVSPE